MKKVAVVLHGQPRYYIAGCINIFKFLLKQNNIEVDFFYHCWVIDEGQKYNSSRPMCYEHSEALNYIKNIELNLISIYEPVAYEYEKQITEFDKSLYDNSIAYENSKNIPDINININNVLSANYSRNKAKNLFEDYVKKTNTKYDYVIFSRFDIEKMPNLKLANLDDSKVNASNNYRPRILFSPALMIMPQEVFIQWFDIYDKLKEFINDDNINEFFKSNGENFSINHEELLLAKYLYTFKNLDNISKEYHW